MYDAIGRVIVECAYLEAAYGDLVSAIGGPLSIYFVRGVSFGQLKVPARKLLQNEHIPEPHRGDALDALERAESLMRERNWVAHGMWYPAPGDALRSAKPVRHSIQADSRDWSLADLHQLAHEVVQCRMDLFDAAWNVTSVSGAGGPLRPYRDGLTQTHSGHLDEYPDPLDLD